MTHRPATIARVGDHPWNVVSRLSSMFMPDGTVIETQYIIRRVVPNSRTQFFQAFDLWTENPVEATRFLSQQAAAMVALDAKRLVGREYEQFDPVQIEVVLQR